VTIGLTFRYQFDLDELLLIYWVQSVAIGVSFFVRMSLAVGRPGPVGDFSDASDRGFMLLFFPVHFGLFHVLYYIFIKPAAFPGLLSPLVLCVAVFVLCHAYSLWQNIGRDRVAGAYFSTLFWLPYARVLPMHVTIISGKQIGAERALLLFLVLKTFADLVMHAVEHQVLRRGEPAQR